MKKRVLVLGVGNTLLQDEGLGVHALERLQADYALPECVIALDGGTLGLDLLSRLDGVTHLLILDAIRTDRLSPTVIRLEGREIPSGLALKLSMHQVGLQELLAAATLLGTSPPQMVLLGLRPVSLDWGTELTPVVAEQLTELQEAAVTQLQAWGVEILPEKLVRSCGGALSTAPMVPC